MRPPFDERARRLTALLLILALTRVVLYGVRATPGLRPPDDGWLRAVQLDPYRMRAGEWALLPSLGPRLGRRAQRSWHEHPELPPRERLLAVPGIGERSVEQLAPWLGL